MGKQQTSPKGSVWAEVEDDPALSSAARLAIATLQAAGKVPVGTNRIIDAGALQDPAARTIAAGVGRFLRIEADQIIAGSGNFDEAVAKKLWSQIVTAKEGVFDKIKANMLAVGALDGQQITGATIRTANSGRRVILDANGLRIEGGEAGDDAFRIDAVTGRVTMTGGIVARDDWSWVNFSDWYLQNSGSGVDLGMGIGFNRSVSPAPFPGGIYLFKDKGGTLGTAVTPPHYAGRQAGRLELQPEKLTWGGDQVKLILEREKVLAQASGDRLTLRMETSHIALETQYSRTRLYLGGSGTGAFAHLGDLTSSSTGLTVAHGWAQLSTLDGFKTHGYVTISGNSASMWSRENGHFIKVSNNGLTSSGRTKQFIMHVPRMSSERDGQMLRHKCTESPYDGIEYWTRLTLDEAGEASWDLPDYVPVIASRRAPWSVLATADRGVVNATLDRGESLYRVHVKGEPRAEVSVLVKGARIVEMEGAAGGISRWEDLGDESPWVENPVADEFNAGSFPKHESGEIIW